MDGFQDGFRRGRYLDGFQEGQFMGYRARLRPRYHDEIAYDKDYDDVNDDDDDKVDDDVNKDNDDDDDNDVDDDDEDDDDDDDDDDAVHVSGLFKRQAVTFLIPWGGFKRKCVTQTKRTTQIY